MFYFFVSACFDLANNFSVKYTMKFQLHTELCRPVPSTLYSRAPGFTSLGSVTGYHEVFCGFRQLPVKRTETEHFVRPRPCPLIPSYIHYTP